MTTVYINANSNGNILDWGTSLTINGVVPPSIEVDLNYFAANWFNLLFINNTLTPKGA